MKKITLTLLLIASLQQLTFAQDTLWRRGGIAALNVNQTSLTNWAAGGENALAASALLSVYSNYKRERAAWDNSLDLAYGLIKQGAQDIHKNEDKIDFTTKYGYDASKKGKLYYAALLNFKSQFAEGFNYPNDSIAISKFAAPAYITMALGLDYKPNKDFSLFFSPLTGKITLVNDKNLADAGAYGVDKAEFQFPLNDSIKIKDGKQSRFEFGAYLVAKYQKDIGKNVNLLTKLDLFSNYAENPQNIDVNWEVLISLKINKLLTATLSTQLLYDDNIAIQEFTTVNQVRVPKTHPDGTLVVGPRTQFKEVFGISLAYKFASYGIK